MSAESASDDLIRNRFLQAALEDLERGGLRPVEAYQSEHQGFGALIAAEHARLVSGELAPDEMPPPVDRVGPYRVLRELGRGGQGVVLLAEDERLGRRVAIKLLLGMAGLQPDSFARFRREAELAARLHHPGLCTVFEAGVEEGVPFVAMEYVEGMTLSARLSGAGAAPPLTPTECMRIVAAVARALHTAHEAGIVHRDVKPANVVLRADGAPVVLDFGLARELEGEPAGAGATRTGDLFGTPAYMAPEQIDGSPRRVDRRADVWALGAMLVEMLTLAPPFRAPTRAGVFRAVLEDAPPNLRRAAPRAPRDLGVVVATALAKDPAHRYADAAALADDLEAVLASRPIAARPPTRLTRVARWIRREPLLAAALAALLFALAAASGLGGYLLARAPELATGEAELARQARERLIAEVVGGRLRGVEAEQRMRAALELDPAFSIGRIALGLHLLREGRRADAVALLDDAPADSDEPEALRRAAAFVRSGAAAPPPASEVETAEEAYVAAVLALEAGADDSGYRSVLELCRRAIYLAPQAHERYLHPLVRAANAIGDVDELARAAQALEARYPDSALAWFYVGMARSHDDPAGAADANARALELDPGFAQAWVILCAMRMLSGDFEAATTAFEAGIAHTDPGSEERRRLLRTRAGLLAQFGFPEDAVEAWGRVLAITPDDASALLARGALLRELERDDEADTDLFRVLELEPGNAQANELLGL